jgi:hypothetical protein
MGRCGVGTKGFWPACELFVDSVHGAEGHDRLCRQPLPLRGVGVGDGGWGRDADGRNPRPEGDAKVPESSGVDHVEVFHLKTVVEVDDSATESATKQSRWKG